MVDWESSHSATAGPAYEVSERLMAEQDPTALASQATARKTNYNLTVLFTLQVCVYAT